MYKLLCLIIMTFMIMMQAVAQENPEPTPPTITYEAEIGWGPFAAIDWQPIAITYQVVEGTVTAAHDYSSKVGVQKWEAMACNSTDKKVQVEFTITENPNKQMFAFYRIRLRGKTDTETGAWSEPSYWAAILDIAAPLRPIRME